MQTVATIVLVFDFFLVAIVEGYLIIVKRRFAKKGWLKEPGYLYVHQSPCFAQLNFKHFEHLKMRQNACHCAFSLQLVTSF